MGWQAVQATQLQALRAGMHGRGMQPCYVPHGIARIGPMMLRSVTLLRYMALLYHGLAWLTSME